MKISTYKYENTPNFMHLIEDDKACNSGLNSIAVDRVFYSGTAVTLRINASITTAIVDVSYSIDSFVRIQNKCEGSYALHFFYTDRLVDFNLGKQLRFSSSLTYNCLLIDGDSPIDYFVERGTAIYAVSIFIKKELLLQYLTAIKSVNQTINQILKREVSLVLLNKQLNTRGLKMINKFKKIAYKDPFYAMYIQGLVENLIDVFVDESQTNPFFISNRAV